MSRLSARRVIAAVVACVSVAATVATSGVSAHAALPGAAGKISYRLLEDPATYYVANADGSGATPLATYATHGRWSPDGSRFAYRGIWDVGIWTVRPDGSARTRLTSSPLDEDPTWSASGQYIVFIRGGGLMYMPSDGAGWLPVALNENSNPALYIDHYPTLSVNNDIVFERETKGVGYGIYKYNPATPATPTLLVANALYPDFSPDGTKLAYTTAANGTAGGGQVWIANADGTNPVQLTTDPHDAIAPSWSPDGTKMLYNEEIGVPYYSLELIDIATKAVTQITYDGAEPSWQPVNRNQVGRVWGQTAIETAIAASQFNYADHGNTTDPGRVQAGAVVLSRSDQFYDALAGSALAVNKHAPLLITPPADTVNAGVLAEIKRVLGTSGTIYLLGGTAALPAAMQNQLTGLGYNVTRLWGATAIETALAIDQQITTTPRIAIVATGAEFYDALAAGAAAGANPGTVIVLSWGDSLPAASATYLNHLNPDSTQPSGTMLVTAGGPGDRALMNAYNAGQLPSWPKSFGRWPLVGNNAKDTAIQVAKFFFAAPGISAVATTAGWYDALTGGAMIGLNYGPLLLTDPTGLYGPLADYLSADSGGMWDAVILGGTAALPATLQSPIGEAISLPGQWSYHDRTPTLSTGAGRTTQTLTPSTLTPPTASKPSGSINSTRVPATTATR